MSQVHAQEQKPATKVNTVSMKIDGDYRYVSAYGIPHHAVASKNAEGITAQSYAFRVKAKPEKAKRETHWKPGAFFGVALDGVPLASGMSGLWNNSSSWLIKAKNIDLHGGMVNENKQYIYAAIPQDLISKDLSHVGYGADGFPVFVSKADKFKSSYSLKEGQRPKQPTGPGGVYDGTYISDYTYIPRSGVLDRCNGVTVNKKYYIYILTREFPYVPLCWSGVPDQSFTKEELAGKPAVDNSEPRSSSEEAMMRRGRL